MHSTSCFWYFCPSLSSFVISFNFIMLFLLRPCKVACTCGLCYIGQMERTVVDRRKEQQRCIKLRYHDKSTLAEHSLMQDHEVLFDGTVPLASSNSYGTHIVREAMAIQLETNLLNRDSKMQLSRNWRPVIHLLAPAFEDL